MSEFWVERPDRTALVGTSDTVATYSVGDGVRIDGALVADDLWTWMDGLEGTWVGYLGYGVKAITRGGRPRSRSGRSAPDALWMRADRANVIEVPAARALGAGQGSIGFSSYIGPEEYGAAIATIKEHLARGESYEVCLTRTITTEAPADPFELFEAMRAGSPTGRAVYLRHGDLAICSATPEEFLTVSAAGVVSSSPIKGTAARHDDPVLDQAAADGLGTEPKTRAENLMIVDLVRNDLNQVCVPGSVQVPRFLAVESYATVHQLVSTVRGTLAAGRTRVDAIRAAFPPGSMTGAPKERTMQIIDALEPSPRGVYSGVIGVLGDDGSADLRVVIRTAVVNGDETTIGTGGAIVWGSDPESEWAETELKAGSVLAALARVGKNERHG